MSGDGPTGFPPPDDPFWRVHDGLEREGPGSDATTRRLLGLLPDLTGPVEVLDLGCGPGGQTTELARALPQARITAVDLHPPFLAEVARRAADAGAADRVRTALADIGDPQALAPLGPVDVVWSEGAVWAVGFEAALAAWRDLLRPGGALVVTEAVWTAPTVPQAVRDLWDEAYPGMQPPQVRRAQAERAGYRRVGDLLLPREDWAAYHDGIRARLDALGPEAGSDPGLADVIAAHRREIEVFEGGGDATVGYLGMVLRRT